MVVVVVVVVVVVAAVVVAVVVAVVAAVVVVVVVPITTPIIQPPLRSSDYSLIPERDPTPSCPRDPHLIVSQNWITPIVIDPHILIGTPKRS